MLGSTIYSRITNLLLLSALLIGTLSAVAPAVVQAAPAPSHTDDPTSVTIAGSLQDELGCPGDWQPDCAATHLTNDTDDDVWQGTFALPAGSWEYKAALNDSWDENYGANAQNNGSNISLNIGAATDIKFYYDHKSHWITDNQNSVIATLAGSLQSELGCPGDWQPDCLRSWLQDPDGDGIYTFETSALPAGNYETKVAHNESWDENYGADGQPNGANILFSVASGATVTFSYDPTSHLLTITSGGLEPGDKLLVRPALRVNATEEIFYFVLPDRFDNGDTDNDSAGDTSGDPLLNGFLPSDKGYYHGGDIAGLRARLDYLDNLDITAIWMTPQFTNNWVQGDGTIAGSSAAYHGYWQTDYTQIDPHFGTNEELQAFIDDAHSRNIKVFFDVVINHTGDIISYAEGTFTYRNKENYPYKDASGAIFDDRDFAGGNTFPDLDATISFPYTPIFPNAGGATAKNPAWLNDPIYYHNRGNSTFAGESSLYGDFFGLDDLFTEHPDVVDGMIDIHKNMISSFGIDGFRVDTVKHVNDELWQRFVPEIQAHAATQGIDEFFIFGEVFDSSPAFVSRFSTELPFPSMLDFGFDSAARQFAAGGGTTDNLRDLFADDDYYTDDDSNAHALVKFLGNHDMGRLGYNIDSDNPGAPDAERVARSTLAHALMFFSRGIPLIYYGDEQGFTGDGGDKDARQDMMPSLVPSYNDDNLIGTAATTADANFDETHILYQRFSDFAQLRDANIALAQGAQIHRYNTTGSGIYAFSRIERSEQVEYLIVLNNAKSDESATVATGTPDALFSQLWPGTGPALNADPDGNVDLTIPALGFALYRADRTLPVSTEAPGIMISKPIQDETVLGRVEVEANVDGPALAEVTFAVSVDGGEYQVIGTDDNPPYRVFYDVSDLPAGTPITFKAIVDDLAGNLNADKVSVLVGQETGPQIGPVYAVIHYLRADGDYGDHTTGDFNDFWGLHLWGDGIDASESTEWTSPKPFLGEDEYGRFAWIKLNPGAKDVNFIIHRGDSKDGTGNDRTFDPSLNPQIWTRQDDGSEYTSQAEAQGYVTIRYRRPAGDYGDPLSPDYNDFWGLHLWGNGLDPAEATDWTAPKKPDGFDDFGAYFNIAIQDASKSVNFIVHRGDTKDPADSPDRNLIPLETPTIWLLQDDVDIYPQRGAAQSFATIHYHRDDGDYGDPTSSDFNDFWGMHVWAGAATPNPSWTEPVRPAQLDLFGPSFTVDLTAGADGLAYILHRGDTKDPGPDQFLAVDPWGYEVWQLEGEGPDPAEPHYVLPILAVGGPGVNPGDIDRQQAYWVDESTIAWDAATDDANSYTLHYASTGGLSATEAGITGGISITLSPGVLSDAVKAKFPHLATLPALQINATDLSLVPEILKGQIAVSAVNSDGESVDATGLQIAGVLDDLYTYDGPLGIEWESDTPTLHLWAPTAKSVTFHLFADADPATTSSTTPMVLDPVSGVWSITGAPDWKGQYYLFEVEIFVHSTGQVERNIVTDPYSLNLSVNSGRSQIVDLADSALMPDGWDSLVKPPQAAPEDISIYEIHVRDFSVNDPTVPDELKGTYKAFTLESSNGIQHLQALQDAGLSHLHLLPVFDIATVNENRAEWQEPDPAVLATFPPDSEEQQAAVTATEELDGFNWGYDPFHYTTPEGSYAGDPDGSDRIVEFREMVQALNEMGLRVVMDVVYNHTNSAGQSEKSVLDRIVPGYYHRLDANGTVETSTCCPNTASEHNMMEKLMVDSLLTWATAYKIDAFRFDLMGHHMKSNMIEVREALDALTMADDNVDGPAIYIYGEGWNFGEVADNARGENATQLNVGGLGIGTFSDRLRDAVRGGGPFDGGNDLISRQGFANGLYYDPNALNSGGQNELDTLLLNTDQIRVGMAGNLAGYQFIDRNGNLVSGADVDYNGQPAGYTQDPQEDITYISKHDNQTLYDNNTYKAPISTSMDDRVRIQNVGLATVLLGQGVPFMHAGSDLLRSKSLDRDSFNSGDWFNALDFTYQSNNWGVGLPVAGKNQDNWPIMQPLLANPALEPAPDAIQFSARLLQELLQVRYSSPLFRLQTAEMIQNRVGFHNTGSAQLPGLIVMSLSDLVEPDLDPDHEFIVVLINANDEAQTIQAAAAAGLELELHPVQASSVDGVVKAASFDTTTGAFNVPARTAAIFVMPTPIADRYNRLVDYVEQLLAQGILNAGQANSLLVQLEGSQNKWNRGSANAACNQLQAFMNHLQGFVNSGILSGEQATPLLLEAEKLAGQICEPEGSVTADTEAGSSAGINSHRDFIYLPAIQVD